MSLLNVWSLLCYGRIQSYATLITYELLVLQYARGYGIFEMLTVNKMKDWDSSGVQKNEIVFKISKSTENITLMPKELLKHQRHCKNP